MRQIIFTRNAQQALKRMPTNTARLIVAKIGQYAEEPQSLSRNVKKLQGRDGYRLRVGNWRVIFDEDGSVLNILEIGPRGSVYE